MISIIVFVHSVWFWLSVMGFALAFHSGFRFEFGFQLWVLLLALAIELGLYATVLLCELLKLWLWIVCDCVDSLMLDNYV